MAHSDNSNDFRNTDWFQEIESIYQTFSLIIDDRYKPGSKKEIDNAKIEVENLKRKYKGNKDFEKELSYLEKELEESMKRRFNGSIITIIGVAIGILVLFYFSNRVETKSGELLIDKAEQIQQNKIEKLKHTIKTAEGENEYINTFQENLKTEIAKLEKEEQSNQIKERLNERNKSFNKNQASIDANKNKISESKKEIEFLSSMTAEEYRDYKVNKDQDAAASISNYGWKTVLWFLLYIASTFPFVFTINKNGKRRKSSRWLGFLSIILGSASTIRYRRPDGSTYDDNSQFAGAFALVFALSATAIVLTIVLLPYIAVIAFVKNIVLPYFI